MKPIKCPAYQDRNNHNFDPSMKVWNQDAHKCYGMNVSANYFLFMIDSNAEEDRWIKKNAQNEKRIYR